MASKKKNNKEKEKEVEEMEMESGAVNNEENADETKNDTSSEQEATKKESGPKEAVEDGNHAVEELQIKLAESQDKYIRLSAEFDNYRKRTLKEKTELLKSAGEQLLLSLLPVVDDFERGMSTMNDAKDIKAVKDGVELIYTKFTDFLKQNGVKEIEAIEQEFDTDLHEAVTKIPAPKEEFKGKIVDVIQKGYKLNDKVIRFAKVVVGE